MKTYTTTQPGKLAMTIRHLTALVVLSLVLALPACTQETGRFTGKADGKSETACYLNAELDAVRQAVNLFYGTRYESEVRIINGKIDISQISAKGQGELSYEVVTAEDKTSFHNSCERTIVARTSTSNRESGTTDVAQTSALNGGPPLEEKISTDPDPELTWHKCEKEDDVSACEFAAGYYTKACDKGDATGCTRLGVMHKQGLWVKRSTSSVAFYYKKACDGGSTKGCFNKKACKRGSALGCFNFARMNREGYNDGRGFKQNDITATKYYIKACDRDNDEGCDMAGWMYRHGIGVDQSDTTAMEYYEKACDKGNLNGCDWSTPVKYYKKSCRYSVVACERAAKLQ